MADSPMITRMRCGCDCMNESEFEPCETNVQLPCCQYCHSAPCAYVIKWGCPIGDCHGYGTTCYGMAMPGLTALWRECLFGEKACEYTARSPDILAPLALPSESDCDSDDDPTSPIIGQTTVNARSQIIHCGSIAVWETGRDTEVFDSITPPIWLDTDGNPMYRKIPFKGCCHSSYAIGGADFTANCGWFDHYKKEYTYHATGVDGSPAGGWENAPWAYTNVLLRLVIDGFGTAVLYGYAPGNDRDPVFTFVCNGFNCTGDSTFELSENTDPDQCIGLPHQICVSPYSADFKTPCQDGQAVCDCCDPGYDTAPFVMDAPGCEVDGEIVLMTRGGSLGLPCGGSFADPGGDCGYFTGSIVARAITPVRTLHLLEWCNGSTWYMHMKCCQSAYTDDNDVFHPCECIDLGIAESDANCSCPDGASPEFSLDLGECCIADGPCCAAPDDLTATLTNFVNCDAIAGTTIALTKPDPDVSTWTGSTTACNGTIDVTLECVDDNWKLSVSTTHCGSFSSQDAESVTCDPLEINFFGFYGGGFTIDPACTCCDSPEDDYRWGVTITL